LNLLPTVLLDDSNVPEVGCATLDRPNKNSTPVGSGRKKKQAAIARLSSWFAPALQSASPRRNPPRNRL